MAAHEFGHMMGLRHSYAYPSANLMYPSAGATAPSKHFINATIKTEGGPPQNAVTELEQSFLGQKTVHDNA